MAVTTVPEYAIAFSIALGALGTFITSIVSIRHAKENGRKLESVQEVINGAAQQQADRIDQLTSVIEEGGTPAPPKTPRT